MAAVFVFSGRPNPTWSLDSKVTGEIERIWDRLEPSKLAAEPAARLGYTGCTVRNGWGKIWTACGGLVTLREGEHEDRRADPDRAFEHAVIALAPPGELPPLDSPLP
jgi:hypothetical protein